MLVEQRSGASINLIENLSRLVLQNSAGRGRAEKIPFYLSVEDEKLHHTCQFMSSRFEPTIRQTIYYCKNPEYLLEYKRKGAMMLSCIDCPKHPNSIITDSNLIINHITQIIREAQLC